jgi:hypothetical protein
MFGKKMVHGIIKLIVVIIDIEPVRVLPEQPERKL